MKIKLYSSMIVAFLLAGCSDYLDIVPKGKLIPETLEDFESLASNPSFSTQGNPHLEQLADGHFVTEERISAGANSSVIRIYSWENEFYLETESDYGWDPMYNNIYNANIILSEHGNIKTTEQRRLDHIKGDALFNRALSYWNLVSYYAEQYNPQTAATDLAVPIHTVPDLEAKQPRATVKEVYDLLLSDLEAALPLLPDESRNPYRRTKAACLGLLARVHLGMSAYDKAKSYATQALAVNSSLFDFNSLSFTDPTRPARGILGRPLEYKHPEMISYGVTNFGSVLTNSTISPELLALIDKKDLRFKFGWTMTDRNGDPIKEPYPLRIPQDLNYNISVSEMMLIIAEADARAGNADGAIAQLNKIRKYRFTPEDYQDLKANNADEALTLVINERRVELFGKGLRWYDMKRLDKDPKFRRDYKRANTSGDFTLKAGSPKFLTQIPAKVRLFNQLPLNPR